MTVSVVGEGEYTVREGIPEEAHLRFIFISNPVVMMAHMSVSRGDER